MIDGHLKVLFYRLPPNSQLPLSKPGNAPLSEDLHEPVAPPGCVKTKSCVKPKVNVWRSPSSLVSCKNKNKFPTFILRTRKPTSFLGFNFRGVPSMKQYPNFDFWPSGCVGSKSCIKQKGSLLWKMFKFQNFGRPLASPTFRPCFLRLWAKNQNFTPNILFADSKKVWHCSKTLEGDRFGRNPLFRGPGLTQGALGSEVPAQKVFAWS